MYHLLRPLLFGLDPETAHGLSIAALRSGLPVAPPPRVSERLRVRAAGLEFPNPLGMAAGYDKDAEVTDGLLRLGFGFVEVGSVTPLAQAGNPRPRLFRLPEDRAVINRMSFNNAGHKAMLERLSRRRNPSGIVGVNIGANRDSADRIADYALGIERLGPVASYFTINVSSPNTPGLRQLQDPDQLQRLLSVCLAARDRLARRVPLLVKIAPDLGEAELDAIAEAVLAAGLDGMIVSNTTVDRSGLTSGRHADEAGGLSGAPLFVRSTVMLARMRRRVGPRMTLIGVGGVESAETALEKIRAGADLVQIYTGLVYGGPSLPGRILAGLDAHAEREGLARISEIRDSRTDFWADRRLATDEIPVISR